jgi:Holliday junction DNA helicase RuvB
LKQLFNKYNGGPVGLNTIAASLSEEQATVEEFNEPYLIQMGLSSARRADALTQ